jgi:hypothetical protein
MPSKEEYMAGAAAPGVPRRQDSVFHFYEKLLFLRCGG